MYPYIEFFWITIHTTWLWIIAFLFTFIFTAYYLTNKYHQDFLKFFYWLPLMIIISYFFGAYFSFFHEYWFIPNTLVELKALILPANYWFSFAGTLFWFVVSTIIFFSWIKRTETKKVWIDIFFLSVVLGLVPLWIFAIFSDTFIGKINESWFSIKALHPQSQLNKYNWVLPIWLFLSVWSLICGLFFVLWQRKKKSFWYWTLWFIVLLVWINIIFFFQQYPKHIPINILGITFDIKHYMSFFVIMFLLYIHNIRNWKNS